MTDPRRTVMQLFALDHDDDADDDLRPLEDPLDEATRELLFTLCSHLSLAAAAARGKSLRKNEARERAAEYAAGICLILDVWESEDVAVIDGPCLTGLLGFPLYD